MTESPNLALPYLQSQKAQKQITLNEAIAAPQCAGATCRPLAQPPHAGATLHVSDEAGAAVLASRASKNLRRVTDRAGVSCRALPPSGDPTY